MSFTYKVIDVSLGRIVKDMVSKILQSQTRKVNLTTCNISTSYLKQKYKLLMRQKGDGNPPINPQPLVKRVNPSPIKRIKPAYLPKYFTWSKQAYLKSNSCIVFLAELLVDKAMDLKFIGGTYGGNIKPCPFLCLVLKMLQIQPEKDIIVEFIKNEDYKYVQLSYFYLLSITRFYDVMNTLPLICKTVSGVI